MLIDEEKTFREKGYQSCDLTHGSHKEVWRVCDGCKTGRWIEFKSCSDLCHSCANKKEYIQKCEVHVEKLPWIDDEITFAEKGYRSTDLKPNSTKPVWAVCANPDCKIEGGRGRWVTFQQCSVLCQLCAHKTDEFRDKISNANSGKNHPMYGRTGEDSPTWKGGISSEKMNFYNSFEYAEWRISVFDRDGYTCQECGDDKGGNLQAHHILPVRDYKDRDYSLNIDNGITLCEGCHDKVNGKEYEFVERYQQIVADKKRL